MNDPRIYIICFTDSQDRNTCKYDSDLEMSESENAFMHLVMSISIIPYKTNLQNINTNKFKNSKIFNII